MLRCRKINQHLRPSAESRTVQQEWLACLRYAPQGGWSCKPVGSVPGEQAAMQVVVEIRLRHAKFDIGLLRTGPNFSARLHQLAMRTDRVLHGNLVNCSPRIRDRNRKRKQQHHKRWQTPACEGRLAIHNGSLI